MRRSNANYTEKSLSLFATIPISIVIGRVVFKGILEEYERGCSAIIRPLGHGGLLSVFIIGALVDQWQSRQRSLSCFVSAAASLSSAAFVSNSEWCMHSLLVSGLWLLRETYSFPGIIMLLILIHLYSPIEDHHLNTVDAFAHAGHVTLLASSCMAKSFAFCIACILVIAYCVVTQEEDMFLHTTLAVLASMVFLNDLKCLSIVRDGWPCRVLWDCERGVWMTWCFVLYGACIMMSHFICGDAPASPALFSIHVGGILATCVFIFPQIAQESFSWFQKILCLASSSDSVWCVLGFFHGDRNADITYQVILIGRSLAAALCTLSIASVTKPTTFTPFATPFENAKPKSTRLRGLRLCGVFVYIVISFVQYALLPDTITALAHISHFCFIIGCLAIDAVLEDDALMRNIVTTLVISEAMGVFLPMALYLHPFSYEIWGAAVIKFVCILFSMPWSTAFYQKNVLTFSTQ